MRSSFAIRPLMRPCLGWSLSAAASLLLWTRVGRAQTTSSGPAELLFVEARALQAAGRTQEACEKFAASQALEPAPGTLLNLAGCYEALGRTATAWATYRQASASALERGKPQWASVADERAQKLESLLPRIRIEMGGRKPDASVVIRLDKKVLEPGALGSSLPVDPGPHEVDATRSGATPFRRLVEPRSGHTEEVVVEFEPAASIATPSPLSKPAIPVLSWVFGGAAVASLGVGFAFLGLRESSASQLQEQGCRGALVPEKYALCTDIRSVGDTRAAVEVVGFAAAGAFTVAAVALVLARSKPVAQAAKSASSVCLPTLGGLSCRASF